MRIRSFGVYGYRGKRDSEWDETFPYPSWPEIEAAIRRLDANEYAGVDFVLEGVYGDGGGQPSLHITGGQGQYVVTYGGGGGSSVSCVDPRRVEPELIGVVQRG